MVTPWPYNDPHEVPPGLPMDPALRRLVAIALHHRDAFLSEWAALGLTDDERDALLSPEALVLFGGLANGVPVERLANACQTFAPMLRWSTQPWPEGCHPAPTVGEVERLVADLATRTEQALADAADLMADGIPEDLALRYGSALALRGTWGG